MNSKTLIATTTLIALLGAGSAAFAVEATQDFPAPQIQSSKSRADVMAEAAAAQRNGTLSYHEASPAPVAASTITRTQVLAETREAQRLGLLNASNEGEQRIATPAEQESIRLAGQRAVETSVAQSVR